MGTHLFNAPEQGHDETLLTLAKTKLALGIP